MRILREQYERVVGMLGGEKDQLITLAAQAAAYGKVMIEREGT